MGKLWGLLLVLCLATPASADGVPEDRGAAEWSTIGGAGNRISIARVGPNAGDAAAAPADYNVCNTTPMNGDGTQQTVVVYGGPRSSVHVRPGECHCAKRPNGLTVYNGYEAVNPLQGRFQRFKSGFKCQSHRLSAGKLQEITRRPCTALPPVVGKGTYAAWSCDIFQGLPKKKRNVRFCSEGDDSVVKKDGNILNTGNYVVASRKLITESIVKSEGGQPREEFAVMANGCIDYYGVSELFLIAPNSDTPPAEIFLTGARWQILPGE